MGKEAVAHTYSLAICELWSILVEKYNNYNAFSLSLSLSLSPFFMSNIPLDLLNCIVYKIHGDSLSMRAESVIKDVERK